jgi:hypothetical protein
MTDTSLDIFTAAYIDAALWSSTDDQGNPLDSGEHELATATRNAMIADCARFQQKCALLLQSATDADASYGDEYAGHDFWLTRCGHGAGFWGRGLGSIGDQLTNAAHAYGDVDLYIGDDDLIYAA